ncbi:MAG TPA: hypothetical protein VGF73_07405 [Chthoniobacterales bacterium]
MKTKFGLPAFALAVLLFIGLPLHSSSAFVSVSVGIAPPAIPIYEQPLCPAPGYIWTPGYWAYSDFGYYWVPGAWVLAPRIGYLWTPGYWGYSGSNYIFHDGYWGPTIGFYGGIDYGFGYYGSGYYGGRWEGNTFRYNTAVSRVNTKVITNTYVNREVVQKNRGPRTSFNGPGGVQAKPTSKQLAAAKGPHIAPTDTQRSRVEAAKSDSGLRAKNNKGKPNSDAVRNFEKKHQPRAAEKAAAPNRQRTSRQAGNNNQAQKQHAAQNRAGEKANERTAREANKSHAAEARSSRESNRTARNEEAAVSHHRKAAEATRHEQPRKVERAPRETHRTPVVNRHPQAAPHRQPAANRRPVANSRQGARGQGGPGPADKNGKKRKKKGPNDH